MTNSIVTELVKFKVLETTSEEQLMSKAELFNEFQKKQDGFIDSEMIKDVKEDGWYFIYHYENMEKVTVIGQKLRESNAFKEFMPLLDPESLSITFHQQLKTW
jgi:ABC-type uncharacterized transport system substrate-binding protein